jgi:hypothetical protein
MSEYALVAYRRTRVGDHPSLVATDGIYAQLFALPARAYQSA